MEIPELLSPVGDFECLKAAVQNGANAVYLGASSFSARARATNFNQDSLKEAVIYCKLRNVKVNLALNTLIKNTEFEEAIELAIYAYNIGVDAIIVQDIGLATYLKENYPDIPLHASTQMTVHNLDGVKQIKNLGFSRCVLSRELTFKEIENIKNNVDIELEVFVHGALCISYSGQCLLSSMIGGRSGNRGLCAQPCRLPYELHSSNKTLDSGYLLSPRDLCSIELLPELIKAGVHSFKIEGRMKTPTYVATVTKIYRKYIDLVLANINLDNNSLRRLIYNEFNKINSNTMLSDSEELKQVFNRGEFSRGHLEIKENRNLIFKDKPNNMGIYIGEVSNFNENKGHITLILKNKLSVGDKISINSDSYTVSELMINNKNYPSLDKGNLVKIGRMKGNIKKGTKIFKIEDTNLNKSIFPTFKEDKNFRKVKINGEIIIKENTPISLKVFGDNGFYSGVEYEKTLDIIPKKALNKPISKEKILEQLNKTGSTEFEFSNINVILDEGLFIPKISILNELRRDVLIGLENEIIKAHTHCLKIKNDNTLANLHLEEFSENNSSNISNKKISLLLNILNIDYNYLKLQNIDKLYIPLKYFANDKYLNLITDICNKFNTYIYIPSILRDINLNGDLITRTNLLNNIVNKFSLKGFVISHISQLDMVKDFNLEIIGNYNLNVFSNISLKSLEKMNLNTITLSPELNKQEISNILNINNNVNTELIVYGKLPVMTNNYCYLGKSNKCYKDCERKCMQNDIFFLKDRLGFEFRIIPDNTSTITTIFNSKITSIKTNDLNIDNLRIDILDENIDEINNIINTVLSGERFEGKEFTNGAF